MPLAKLSCPINSALHAKRERRKEARPGELLDAALELFVEKGFAATRAEEVAARAGVSKGTLFLYFQSKEDLFKAVVRANLSDRIKQWADGFDAFEGTTAEMVKDCMHFWWAHEGVSPASGIAKLMMSEAANFPDLAVFYQREVTEPGHALIRRILQRGVARKEFRAMDLDYAVYSVVAPMIYLLLCKHSTGLCMPGNLPLDPKKYIDSQISVLLFGMNAAVPFTKQDQKQDKDNRA